MNAKELEQALQDVRAAAFLEAIAICEGTSHSFKNHTRHSDGARYGASMCADKIRKAFAKDA